MTIYKNGTLIVLDHDPICDNYQDTIAFYATGRDTGGQKYLVRWDCTEEWLHHIIPPAGCNAPDSRNESHHGDPTMGCPFCDDEHNACNWTTPASIEPY